MFADQIKQGLLCLSLLLSLLFIAGCSSNSSQPIPGEEVGPTGIAQQVDEEGFQLRVLNSSFIDNASANIGLDVAVVGEGAVVTVSATRARGLKAIYLELAYDQATWHPVEAVSCGALGNQALELSVLDLPGEVHHGQVLAGWDSAAGFSGKGELVSFSFARGVLPVARTTSAVPTAEAARPATDLWLDGELLHTRYFNPGDCDLNGEVNISDLTPLGQNFGTQGVFEYWQYLYAVDGDHNGEINIADLTTIGANYGNTIAGFNIYRTTTPDVDYPSAPDAQSGIAPVDYFAVGDWSYGPPEAGLGFVIELEGPIGPNDVFWVRPTDGALEGIPSNRTDQSNNYYNQPPLVFFTASPGEGDAPLTVNFDASSSYDPDGDQIMGYSAAGDTGEDGPYFYLPEQPNSMFQHTITDPGNYVVEVGASDHSSYGGSRRLMISVLDKGNAVPFAKLKIHDPRNGDAPHTLTLDMSESFDPDGSGLTFEFDIWTSLIETPMPKGDFEQNNMGNPVYVVVLNEPGYYEIVGRVSDSSGLSNSHYAGQVRVDDNGNKPPRANLSWDTYLGNAPLLVNFSTNEFMTYDSDGEIVVYEIDPEGNQTWLPFDPDAGFDYTYTFTGQYHPRLRVTDDQGTKGYSSTYSLITVN